MQKLFFSSVLEQDTMCAKPIAFSVIAALYFGISGAMLEIEGPVKGGNYCEFHTFNATCNEDEVIVMKKAEYGRMKIGDCVVADLGFVGCHSNVLDLADSRCSGRRTCEIRMPDEMFANTKPCLQELKMYLDARYTCLKVVKSRETTCRKCNHVRVPLPSGYISSYQAQQTGCGTPDCPWRLEARPGQRLNVSLVNFAWTTADRTPSKQKQQPCKVYATIKEVAGSRGETICGENIRDSHVYTSLTNAVELRIVGKGDKEQFLFYYEAIGCGEPQPPIGGWMEHRGDVVNVGCPGNSRKWTLRCVDGDTWQSNGAVPTSCGDDDGLSENGIAASRELSARINIPYGTSIAIVVLVAVVVGAIILSIGLFLVRRRYAPRSLPQQDLHPYSTPTELPMPKDKIYYPSSVQSPYDIKPSDYLRNYSRQGSQEGTVDGYVHIWDRPLPTPQPGDDACSCNASDPPQYNLVGLPPPPPEMFQPPKTRTLGQVYGNNTMARKEIHDVGVDEAEITSDRSY